MNPDAQTPEALPAAIRARLRDLDRAQPIVDPRTDRAVLDAAHAYFRVRPVRSARNRRWIAPFAAAASLVLVAILVWPFVTDVRSPLRDDIDGSGRVDILDVLALARERAAGGAGITDASIDELAYRIVALDAPRGRP